MAIAPTNGTKLARNTSTASGTTSGSPSSSAPSPIPTASMNATRIWVLVKAPSVTRPRRPASCTRSRAGAGSSRSNQVQISAPSLRKNSVQNSAISAPASTCAIVVVTDSAPETRVPELALSWSPAWVT